MITKELVERINFLARKSKTEGLTNEEKAEQQQVRQQYLAAIRAQVKDALSSVEIKKDAADSQESGGSCGCGCGHHHHH